MIVPFVIHHFRGKHILQRQPSVSKSLSDSITLFFLCLDCTLLMYVLVHSVYTMYGWSMVEDWHEQVKDKHPRFTDHPQIQQIQSTLSKFWSHSMSPVQQCKWLASIVIKRFATHAGESIYTQKVILAHSLIFDYMILCFRPCLSHVHRCVQFKTYQLDNIQDGCSQSVYGQNLNFMHNMAWTLLNPNQIKSNLLKSEVWTSMLRSLNPVCGIFNPATRIPSQHWFKPMFGEFD